MFEIVKKNKKGSGLWNIKNHKKKNDNINFILVFSTHRTYDGQTEFSKNILLILSINQLQANNDFEIFFSSFLSTRSDLIFFSFFLVRTTIVISAI